MNPSDEPVDATDEEPKPALHFAYEHLDKTELFQGDVLARRPDLIKILEQYHPYFKKDQYKYFMVLTQSCGLARRGDDHPSASHIVLAAVRPVDVAIRREAVQFQVSWQVDPGLISTKGFNNLRLLVERIVDNSERDYFYLHEEPAFEIHGNQCAFLRVAFSLKREHYKTCLNAKIAQLKEAFQAKLGWLVGILYNQVGAPEWDDKPRIPGTRTQLASELIKHVLEIHPVQALDHVAEELRAEGQVPEECSAEELREALRTKRPIPPQTQFVNAATKAIDGIEFIDRIFSHAAQQAKDKPELANAFAEIFKAAGIDPPDDPADLGMRIWLQVSRCVLRDEHLSSRHKVIKHIVETLVGDPKIQQLIGVHPKPRVAAPSTSSE